MKRFISLTFGTFAAVSLLNGIYVMIAQPYSAGTNSRLIIASLIFGAAYSILFVYMGRIEDQQQEEQPQGPELSQMKVEIYGDEIILMDGNQIINL